MLRADFLSQVLTLIRLRAEMVFPAELTAPWALSFDPGAAWFHVVSEGGLRIEASDGRRHRGRGAGDLLVLPQGRGHIDGHAGGPIGRIVELLAQQRDREGRVRIGGGGAATRMITGAFRFEGDNLRDMLAVLPSIIHIPHEPPRQRTMDGSTPAQPSSWPRHPPPRPGASILISRMIDVLVIRLMRIWVQTASPRTRAGSARWPIRASAGR